MQNWYGLEIHARHKQAQYLRDAAEGRRAALAVFERSASIRQLAAESVLLAAGSRDHRLATLGDHDSAS